MMADVPTQAAEEAKSLANTVWVVTEYNLQ
jgi:hypothetical protein